MEGKQQELEVWDDVWMTLCELCAKHYAKQHVLGKRCWETLHSTGKPQGPEAQGAQLGPSSWLRATCQGLTACGWPSSWRGQRVPGLRPPGLPGQRGKVRSPC